ncbi:MAG: HupE/UreJ family protein [Pleurocapsa sp. SU_196_0]|nr:HupE/UreJ family protein [Pleurocapsa sp. SU_196_0]
MSLVYRFAQALQGYAIRYDLFVPRVSTASCVATIRHGDAVQSVVFTPQNLEFSVGGEAAPVDFKGFVLLGIEHILTGYDHLLFLLALLALGGGLRYVLKVVTAFTVAHSITLALTTLHVIHLPAQLVESGIALSIAVVALENLIRRKDAAKLERGRWLVTFAFGLLHGMGFAGILEELSIPAANLPGDNALGVQFGGGTRAVGGGVPRVRIVETPRARAIQPAGAVRGVGVRGGGGDVLVRGTRLPRGVIWFRENALTSRR